MSRKKVIVSPISQRNILKNFGYEAGKVLGTGTYSKVYVVTDQTRKKLACKVVRKKDAGDAFITKFLPRELKIVANIKHPNIVQVYQVIDTKQSVYMLMDFCEKGDLLEYIRMHGPFAVEKCKSIFKQVVDAVHYLHNLDVAHRDIKCENVFLTQKGSAKLGDFGFSRYCKDKAGEDLMSNTFCGSKAYAAPEILRGQFYDPKKYDIWSLDKLPLKFKYGATGFAPDCSTLGSACNIKKFCSGMLRLNCRIIISFFRCSSLCNADSHNALRRHTSETDAEEPA
ncbi:unnamed protein product [Acanthoscelides obtectus]|uniref:Protein kinase domain-containing protein n=1 Tax=Acanthoscelides obtectus TaxID=200917 RepID=A0A9P0Q2L7_ACAOB|nr:unnamed protein product [Acanthoscelides obtectus]CAK1677015.1 Testis-specific serine/threonine-protein kinase 1 [Acanthoscelides obtectus]